MQILPNTTNSHTTDILSLLTSTDASSGHGGGGSGGQGFADVLAGLEAHHRPKVSENLPASQVDATKAPASPTPPTPIKVSQEEFADLEHDLRQAGMSREDIAGLREQVQSDEGLTWQSLMQQVNQTLDATSMTAASKKQTLSNEEKRELQGFFQKLGFTPVESKELMSQLANGQDDKAWQRIQAKLNAMAPHQGVTIHTSELAALTKAMGLGSHVSQSFGSLFNAKGELTLNRDGLTAIATTLRQSKAATQGELANIIKDPARAALNEKLDAALNKAMDAAQREKLASNTESKEVQNQKVNIKDAAAKNHRQAGEETVAQSKGETPDPASAKAAINAKAGANEAQAPDAQLAKELKDGLGNASKDTSAKDAKDGKAGKDANAQQQVSKDALKDSFQGKQAKQEGGDSFWQDLLGKVQVDPASHRSTAATADPVLAATKANEAFQQAQQRLQQAKGNDVFRRADVDPQKVFKTVEQGLFKSLQDGGKQLALRMDPPDLGRVTVILQIGANKEVSATLRADTRDAAALLNQQLQQLRQSLEQQGLKVEKLEVQTNVTQDQQQSTQWSGAGQHNQAQEKEARQAELRSWGFLRKQALQDGLAQEMQNGEGGAGFSHPNRPSQGLNIIA